MAPPVAAGAAGPLSAFIQSMGGVGASVAGSTIANLLPALLQSTVGQGGVLRTQPGQQTSGTPSKFAITPQDICRAPAGALQISVRLIARLLRNEFGES